MKALQWISVALITIGGIITIVAFGIIMQGSSDSLNYDVVLTVGKISGIITIVGLLCGSIRAIASLKQNK